MRMIFVIAGVVLAFTPSFACAIDIFVQAEDYRFSHDIALDPIQSYQSLLYGLDYAGEWTQYELQATGFGTYGVTMRCWGEANVPYRLQLVTIPADVDGIPQTINFDFIGKGNCGS